LSKWRRVVSVLAVFLALILVLISSLPFITASMIKLTLSSQGMLNPVVSIEKLGFEQIKFKSIGFTTRLLQQDVSVTLLNVQLSYSIEDLVSGKINQMLVPRASIVVTESLGPESNASMVKIPTELPQVSKIPFSVLTLGHINIVKEISGKPVAMMDVGGSLKVEQNKLLATLEFTQKNNVKMAANLVFDNNRSLALTMSDQLKSIPWLKVIAEDVAVDDEYVRMDINSTLDLGKGYEWLRAWGFSEGIKSAQGNMDVKATLGLPVAYEVNTTQWRESVKLHANIDINANIPEWKTFANKIVANLGLMVSFQEGVLNWQVKKETRLSCIPNIKKLSRQNPWLQAMLAADRNSSLTVSFPDGVSGESSIKDQIDLSSKNEILVQFGSDAKSQYKLIVNSLLFGVKPSVSVKGFFEIFAHSKGMEGISIDSFSSHVKGMAEWKNDVLAVNIQPETRVKVNSLKYNSYQGKSISSVLLDPVACQYKTVSNEFNCDKFKLSIKPAGLSIEEMDIAINDVILDITNLSFNDDGPLLSMKMSLNEMVFDLNDYAIKIDTIKSDVAYSKNKLNVKGILNAANDDIAAHFSVQQNNINNAGTMTYKLASIDFSETKSIPSRLLYKGSLPLVLNAGRLLAQGGASWKKIKQPKLKKDFFQVANNLQIKIDNLDGAYQKTQFKGLSTQFELQGRGVEGWSFKTPAKVTLDLLDPGIEITQIILVSDVNLSADFEPMIKIKNLSAHSLGGIISSEIIDIDLTRKHNPFVLRGNGLDLAELLALEQDQGVSGTGLVDGELPFDYSLSGLSMSKGQLAARVPGGVLRYVATERIKKLAESNANIKLLLDALSDFNYSELTAKTQYSPDGKLEFKIALKGRNPGFQRGKPVHLNVNVEENILTLLRSLQLGDELSNKIDRSLNK